MPSDNARKIVTGYARRMAEAKREFFKEVKLLGSGDELSEEDCRYIYSNLNPAHITTARSTSIGRYQIGASFRILMANYILEKRSYKKYSIAPGANNKLIDGEFIQKMGFPVPKVHQSKASPIDACDYVGCIVKSRTGAASKGVFLNQGENFFHFFDRKFYSKDEFLTYCNDNKIRQFIVEDFVGEEDGVRDLKFYMFYGETGTVLEILRGKDGNKHCFYDENSALVETGRYRDTAFKGTGFGKEHRQCAEKLSSLIPSPFIRIDMIVGNKGHFVGEITAHPGGFEDFNPEWDHKLGVKFIQARARLMEDLLSGKKFDDYLNRARV